MMELKPCPFCGGEVRIGEYPQLSYRWQIVCDNHELSETQSHTCFIEADTEQEAIEAWNIRAERTCVMTMPLDDYFGKPEQQYGEELYPCFWFRCSSCGGISWNAEDYKYCPHCGAKVVE